VSSFPHFPFGFASADQTIVVAAATFGDPSWVVGKPYDKGNATKSGRFARKDTTALDQWGSVLGAWCGDHDFFCASGDSVSVHTSEVETYGRQAAAFVVGLVRGGQRKAKAKARWV
jgi:acetylxylan esterase